MIFYTVHFEFLYFFIRCAFISWALILLKIHMCVMGAACTLIWYHLIVCASSMSDMNNKSIKKCRFDIVVSARSEVPSCRSSSSLAATAARRMWCGRPHIIDCVHVDVIKYVSVVIIYVVWLSPSRRTEYCHQRATLCCSLRPQHF